MSLDNLLPSISTIAVTGTKDAPTVTYGGAASFAAAHGVVASLVAEDPDASNNAVVWTIRSFGTSGTLTPPKLPAAQAARIAAASWGNLSVNVVAHGGATTAKAFATGGFVIDPRDETAAGFVLPESPVTVRTSRRALAD